MATVIVRRGILRVQLDCFAVIGNRLLIPAFVVVRPRAVIIQGSKVRVELDCLGVIRDRLIIKFVAFVSATAIVVNCRITRLKLYRFCTVRDRLFVIALIERSHPSARILVRRSGALELFQISLEILRYRERHLRA